jgi:AraC-like DNA-binding protein
MARVEGLLRRIRVEREVEDRLASGPAAADWHGPSYALGYSFVTEHPQGSLDGHVHPGMELGMVVAGEVEFYVARAEQRCGPGDVWLCAMWEPHAWRVSRAGTTNIALIFLPDLLGDQAGGEPPYLELFAAPPEARVRVEDADVRRRLLDLGRDTYREIEEKKPFWQTAVRLSLLRILTELSRSRHASPPSVGGQLMGKHLGTLSRVMPALKLVHDRPWNRVTASDAAAACSLSRSHFGHLFRSAMGVSFGKFCQRTRLGFVAHQLLYTNDTVESIAEQTGFVDVSHLSRTFAKNHGCSPSDYRRRRDRGEVTTR